jgi:hypothetical protein
LEAGNIRSTAGIGIGTLLFLVFINDLDEGLVNSVLTFAADTTIFGIVQIEVQHQQLQRDLCSLEEMANAADTTIFGIVQNEVQHQQLQRDLCSLEEMANDLAVGVQCRQM